MNNLSDHRIVCVYRASLRRASWQRTCFEGNEVVRVRAAAFWDNGQLIKKKKNWCEEPTLPKKNALCLNCYSKSSTVCTRNNTVQHQSTTHTYACIMQLKWGLERSAQNPLVQQGHWLHNILCYCSLVAAVVVARRSDSFPTLTNPSSHRLKILYKMLSYLSL